MAEMVGLLEGVNLERPPQGAYGGGNPIRVKYLLDTNACIGVLTNRVTPLVEHWKPTPPEPGPTL